MFDFNKSLNESKVSIKKFEEVKVMQKTSTISDQYYQGSVNNIGLPSLFEDILYQQEINKDKIEELLTSFLKSFDFFDADDPIIYQSGIFRDENWKDSTAPNYLTAKEKFFNAYSSINYLYDIDVTINKWFPNSGKFLFTFMLHIKNESFDKFKNIYFQYAEIYYQNKLKSITEEETTTFIQDNWNRFIEDLCKPGYLTYEVKWEPSSVFIENDEELENKQSVIQNASDIQELLKRLNRMQNQIDDLYDILKR